MSTYAKVGLLSILTAILLFVSVRWLRGRVFGKRGYDVVAVLQDASCLLEGSRVQIAGIQVGTVTKRELTPRGAQLTIHIADESVAIWDDAVLAKKSASLFGDCYLSLDPGHPTHQEEGKEVANHRLGTGSDAKPKPSL